MRLVRTTTPTPVQRHSCYMARKSLRQILGIGLIGVSALLSVNKAKADDLLNIELNGAGTFTGSVGLYHSNSRPDGIYLPPSFLPQVEIYSSKSNTAYNVDARPVSNENIYHVILTGDSGGTGNVYTPASLTFGWKKGPESNRVETAHVHLDSNFTSNAIPYDTYFVTAVRLKTL